MKHANLITVFGLIIFFFLNGVGQAQYHKGQVDRLRSFLDLYCLVYENKDIDKFSTFFTPDAIEEGKPFRSRLAQYRSNFGKIDALNYRIELKRYAVQEGTRLIRIEGIFYVQAKLSGSEKWRKNSGPIAMELIENGDSYLVKRLNYSD